MTEEKKYLDSEGHYFDPEEIKIADNRARKDFPQAQLEELKSSIRQYGQFQPSVLKRDMTLIMGERRLRACRDLGRNLWCVFTDELDPLTLKEMELEENIRREDLNAVEEIIWKEEIHELKKEKYPEADWSTKDTAELLGESKSLTSEDIRFASFIKSMPERFEDCLTKSDIRKRIKKLEAKLTWNIHEATADAKSEDALGVSSGFSFSLPEPEIVDSRTLLPKGYVQPECDPTGGTSPEEKEKKEAYLRSKIQSYGLWLGTGDAFEQFPKVKEGIINICFLDPPWGVELDSKGISMGSDNDHYEDSEATFKESFPILCKIAYEKMAKDSHLYCFFGIVHHEFIFESLEAAGFNVNRRPIICIKEGMHSTRVGDYWWGASYEAIAFAKKGNRKLIIPGKPDSFTINWLSSSKKLYHPSAKPLEVYQRLLRVSALPGDIICDPMYGTGASFAACESLPDLKLSWFGWDLEKENRSKALMRLSESLLGAEAKQSKPDFREIDPKSPYWMKHWSDFPEDQNDMLAFGLEVAERSKENGN